MQRSTLRVTASDGATAALELFLPDDPPAAAIFWLPALGVGIGPNVVFASALAAQGIAVAVHEWRGLGSSDRRASHACDWGYADILDRDLPAAFAAAQHALPAGTVWCVGGHSLGGQMALIHAARHPQPFRGALLVGSGHPHWRGFGGARGLGVLALMAWMPAVTRIVGYFPGQRLRFAGREAGGLMRDWARSGRRGDYNVAGYGNTLNQALRAFQHPVLAVRLADDWLAPKASLTQLRTLAPAAAWRTEVLQSYDFAHGRADHFGWLKQPQAVAAHVQAWLAGLTR